MTNTTLINYCVILLSWMTNQIIKTTLNEPNYKPKEVGIIGGGLAGLTAAVFLSGKGRSVTIFEKSSEFGGRARTNIRDGFFFNQGPHALYLEGNGPKILDELNVKYSGKTVDSTNYFVIKRGKMHRIPIKLSHLLTTKLLKGLRSKIETIRFFINLNKMNLDELQGISFQEWLDKSFKNSDAKDFVKMLARIATYTYNSETLSAKLALYQIRIAIGGVIYVDGGWQTLVDRLIEHAKSNGVKFVKDKNVVSIEENKDIGNENRKLLWKIRLSDDSVYSFEDVIIATNPTEAYQLLRNNTTINSSFIMKLEKMKKPAKVATLDLALSNLPNPNVYGAYGLDIPLYLSLHSAFARLSTDGNGVLFHVMKYLDSSIESNPVQDKIEMESFLDMFQPGWRKWVVRKRFLPNMIASNTALSYSNGIIENRPDVKVPGVNNLYIIGDWVGPEGMLADTSFSTAKTVALKILDKDMRIKIR